MTDSQETARPVVTTTHGAVRGVRSDGGLRFAGIPFAAPPVGALRLRPPVPAAPWAGVRDASRFPAAPAQHAGITPEIQALGTHAVGVARALGAADGEFSEDCLYLNVWTPGVDGRLPVLMWIYGGAFESGTASPPSFDGTALSRLTGAVVVAANYRVGALGWLHPAGPGSERWTASANLGLQDQTTALRWIRDNVARFGGDPGNVTVAGASAGAFSVGTLLALPDAKGLFHKAILQSGSVTRVQAPDTARALTEHFLSAVGVKSLDELATAPLGRILDAQPSVVDSDVGRRNLPGGRIWGVVHDGTMLPARPLDAVGAGAAVGIPLLIGANRDEIRMWAELGGAGYRPADEGALTAEMTRAGVADPAALLEAYRVQLRGAPQPGRPEAAAPDELRDLRTLFLSDAVYRVPSARLARAQVAAGGPAHTYLLSAEPFGAGTGAFHGAETFYLGDRLAALDIDTPDNRAIRDQLATAWRRFLYTADPGWPTHDPTATPTGTTRLIGPDPRDIHEPPLDIAAHWDLGT
ncbi:carboxylesterase/lipase family protein [Streptomyces sp. NPDC058457]|uniref:carboxylesterase/lipase family protein n=1 Tax=Streptomyces sp. NPDC058457 TaxID=3346507 RepID=UPI00365C5E58